MNLESQELLKVALQVSALNQWETHFVQTASHPHINPKGDDRPYVYANIGGRHYMPCLFDTGAMVSVMSQEVFDQSVNQEGTLSLSAPAQLTVAKKAKDQAPVVMTARTVHVSFSILGETVESFPLRVSPDLSSHTGCIVGIDLIHKLRLSYDAARQRVVAPGHKRLSPIQAITLPPFSCEKIQCAVKNLSSVAINHRKFDCVFDSGPQDNVHVTPMLVGTKAKKVIALVSNPTAEAVTLRSDEEFGRGIVVQKRNITDMSSLYPVGAAEEDVEIKADPIDQEKKDYLMDHIDLGPNLTADQKKRLRELVLQYHQAFARHEYDIGTCTAMKHHIQMKTPHPVYRKQFPLAEVHREFLVEHVKKLLEIGMLRRSTSKFNSPVFAVRKPGATAASVGSEAYRMVVDLRAINKEVVSEYYSGQVIDEILDEVGKMQPKYLSSTDILKGFWNLALTEESKKVTAFSIPGFGKFEFQSCPQGLQNSPSAFWATMSVVLADLTNSRSYLDDVITGSKTFDDHLTHLAALFKRMIKYNMRLNIKKCELGYDKVKYLGFEISIHGAKPGSSKTAAIDAFQPPTTRKGIQSFIGLCNYFRKHTSLFQKHASVLTDLTKKGSGWEGGPLPPEALDAFNSLKKILVSRPLLRYPDYSKEFIVSVDASSGKVGDDGASVGGGLGAALTQIDDDGAEYAIAYASRGLKQHERNYPAFVLESLACTFGVESFSTYVLGRKFKLLTDHKPLVSLSNTHKRTLSRLEQLLGEYDFQIEYRSGETNKLSDFCSRVLNAIEVGPSENVTGQDRYFEVFHYTAHELEVLQDADPWCRAVRLVLEGKRKEAQQVIVDKGLDKSQVTLLATRCYISPDHVIFYRPIHRGKACAPNLLLTPEAIQAEVLRAAHKDHHTGGHKGQSLTQDGITEMYFWSSLLNDVVNYVKSCHQCQTIKGPGPRTKSKGAPMKSFEQETQCNRRVHIDIIGPFQGDPKYRYCLTMCDSFSKYARIAPLVTKSGEEVARALHKYWLSVFSCPAVIAHDQGTEFVNEFNKTMMTLMGITQAAGLPYRPQGQGQIEKLHFSINRFFKAFLYQKKHAFSEWIRALEFSYNTSVSRATKVSPFKLFYTFSPRWLYFDTDGVQNLFYGENDAAQLRSQIEEAQQYAIKNNRHFRDAYNERFNKDKTPHKFKENELVLLHSPLQALRSQTKAMKLEGLNAKLARPWVGPCLIKQVWEDTPGVIIEFARSSGLKGRVKVHPDRLKPYFLAKGEPHPFKKPMLHKQWKAAQWGHDYTVQEEDAPPPNHPMRLRPRRGRPEQWEEEKVSLQGSLPGSEEESDGGDFFERDPADDVDFGHHRDDDNDTDDGGRPGEGKALSADEEEDEPGSDDDVCNNELVTKLANDIEEQLDNSELSPQPHVNSEQKCSEPKLKKQQDAEKLHVSDKPLHSPLCDSKGDKAPLQQGGGAANRQSGNVDHHTPTQQQGSAMTRFGRWFRVRRIPFFKKQGNLPSTEAMMVTSLDPGIPRRPLVSRRSRLS